MTLPTRIPTRAVSLWSEFHAFLIKQNVLALAIGVVIGAALNDVVKAIVEGLIMPVVAAVSPDPKTYQELTWAVGGAVFKPGIVLAALLNFLIIGLVAWRLTKLFIRPETPSPSAATRACPFCFTTIDARASKCQHCTSELAPTSAA